MKIPGAEIAREIETLLAKEVSALKKKGIVPHLTTILVGESSAQESFVRIKKQVATRLGIKFDFIHLKRTPTFEKFANLLKDTSQDPKVTGIIVQQPLPSDLGTDTIYKYIPREKEIEHHRNKSPFAPPLGLAVLTALKFVFHDGKISHKLLVDLKQDVSFFKPLLRNKKIVLVGRGITGGQPIGKALSMFKINYLNTSSQTFDSDQYYKEADIIISAVGKKVISPANTKHGAILITAGVRREQGKLRGDYDEKEIDSVASYYTPTPGGVGPLDVLYLYKNLIDAAKLQHAPK